MGVAQAAEVAAPEIRTSAMVMKRVIDFSSRITGPHMGRLTYLTAKTLALGAARFTGNEPTSATLTGASWTRPRSQPSDRPHTLVIRSGTPFPVIGTTSTHVAPASANERVVVFLATWRR
jgi:hypothetical protein